MMVLRARSPNPKVRLYTNRRIYLIRRFFPSYRVRLGREAIATGASAFHTGVAPFASARLVGVATVPWTGRDCLTLPTLFRIDAVLKTGSPATQSSS